MISADTFWTMLLIVWFFLPAGVANATPVFANKIPVIKHWKTPLDFGKTFRGQRIFGQNKTFRGLLTAALAAATVGGLQYFFLPVTTSLVQALSLSALMGAGALIGDAVESFFKRRIGVPAGHSWFPFDQTDYIIGALVFIYPFTGLQPKAILVIFVSYFGLHLVSAYIGYLIGLKDKPV